MADGRWLIESYAEPAAAAAAATAAAMVSEIITQPTRNDNRIAREGDGR